MNSRKCYDNIQAYDYLHHPTSARDTLKGCKLSRELSDESFIFISYKKWDRFITDLQVCRLLWKHNCNYVSLDIIMC